MTMISVPLKIKSSCENRKFVLQAPVTGDYNQFLQSANYKGVQAIIYQVFSLPQGSLKYVEYYCFQQQDCNILSCKAYAFIVKF